MPSAAKDVPGGQRFIAQPYYYGKLVDEGGTILTGFEHACTGRSEAFPAGYEESCHPAKFGAGDRSPLYWDGSPWEATGAFAVRPLLHVHLPKVQAVRVRQRLERPPSGRRYTEAHYAIAEPGSYDWAALLGLSERLDTEPLHKIDPRLPPIEFERRDCPLPDDWLARATSWLRALLSSVPMNEHGTARSVADFILDMACLLASLPGTLVWRVTIGAGVTTVDSGVAASLSMVPGPGVIRGKPPPAGVELRSGDAYVAWLTERCAAVQTFGDLARTVAEGLPDARAVDAVKTDLDWVTTSRIVAETVAEMRSVSAYFRQDGNASKAGSLPRPIRARHFMLETAFTAMLEGRREGAVALSRAPDPSWAGAWERFAVGADGAEARVTLAKLFGGLRVAGPVDLAVVRGFALDPSDVESVAGRVEASCAEANPEVVSWPSVLHARDTDAPWFQRVRERVVSKLVWRLLGAIANGVRSEVPSDLPDDPPVRAARALVSGGQVDSRELDVLLQGAGDGDHAALTMVAASLSEHNKVLALKCLLLVSPGRRASAVEQLRLTAEDVLRAMEQGAGFDPAFLGPLTAAPASVRDASAGVRRQLGHALGDPYYSGLCDDDPMGCHGEHANQAEAAFLGTNDPLLIDPMVERLGRFEELARARALKVIHRFVAKPNTVLEGYPTLRDLKHIATGHAERVVATSAGEVDRLTLAARALELPPEALCTAELEPLLRVGVSAWNQRPPPPLSSRQLARLLEAVIADDRARTFWISTTERRGWANLSGWRWVGSRPSDCDAMENQALASVSGSVLARLVCQGLPVPPYALKRVEESDVLDALDGCRDDDALRPHEALVKAGREARSVQILDAVLLELTRRLHLSAQDLVDATGSSWFRGPPKVVVEAMSARRPSRPQAYAEGLVARAERRGAGRSEVVRPIR